MPSLMLLLSACSYMLPPELLRIEHASVKAYDQALAEDLDAARDTGVAIAADWTLHLAELNPKSRFYPSDEVVAGMNTAIEALTAATEAGDPLAVARAANDVASWMDDFDQLYGDRYPYELRLDTASRSVVIDALAGDFTASADALPAIDEAWDPVRSWLVGFEEEEADNVVADYDLALDDLHDAVVAGDADAVVTAVETGLELTRVMRRMPWIPDTTTCIAGCND